MNKEAYLEVENEAVRMCNYHTMRAECESCPAHWKNNKLRIDCFYFLRCPEDAFEVIEKWSKENPRKAGNHESK